MRAAILSGVQGKNATAQAAGPNLAGRPADVSFSDFCRLVEALGFSIIRTSGSHRIYGHRQIPELVNVQDVGGDAKPYQIRQVLRLVERYNLRLGDAP